MRSTPALLAALALTAGLAGCVDTGTAPGTVQFVSSADYGGCAPLNIGTPDNPRFMKDPACGRN